MNVQSTVAELAIFRKSKLHRNGTTTLIVGDINTPRRAGSHLMTRGTVCQIIVDKNIGVAGSGNMEVADGERSVDSIHRNGRVRRKRSFDALAISQLDSTETSELYGLTPESPQFLLGEKPTKLKPSKAQSSSSSFSRSDQSNPDF
jgi:hypothetical protein